MLQNYFVQLLFSATLLLLLATITALVFRKSSASTRHRIWSFSVIGLLIMPLLVVFAPKQPIGTVAIHAIEKTETLTPAPHGNETVEAVPPYVESLHSYEPEPVVVPENEGVVESLGTQFPAREIISFSSATAGKAFLGVWAFGIILLLSRFLLSLLGVRRLMKRLHSLKDVAIRQTATEIAKRLNVRRPVRLLQSEVSSSVPFTTGIFAPTIVVPPEFTSWDESRRRSVLAHEMGHVARRDVAWQMLCKIAVALYWFHPLAWLAAWRLRIERELACDDLVLLHGEKPSDYADVLLELADNLKGRDRRYVLGCTVAMARKNAVRQRIVSILNPTTRRTPLGKIGSAIVLLLAVVGISVAAMLGPPKTEHEASASEPATAAKSVVSQNIQPEEKKETIDDLLTELSGRIVDESGKPLKGVILRLVESQDNRNKLRRLSERSSDLDEEIRNHYRQMFLHGGDMRFSEDDGTFKIKTSGNDEVLLVISPGLASREIRTTNTLRTTTRGNLGDIVLYEGIAPTVHVLTPDGKPQSDVWVNLFPVDETGSIYIGKSGISYGGKFTFPPVEPGEYNISISKRGSRNAVGGHASSPFISSPDVRLVPFAFPKIPVTVSKESKEFSIQALETVTVMLRFQGDKNPNISRWNPSTVFSTDLNDKTGLNWKCTWEEGDAMGDGVYRFRVPKNVPLRFALPHGGDNTFYVAVLPGQKDPITMTDSLLSENPPLKPVLLPAMQNDCDMKIIRITWIKTDDMSQIPNFITVTTTDKNGKVVADTNISTEIGKTSTIRLERKGAKPDAVKTDSKPVDSSPATTSTGSAFSETPFDSKLYPATFAEAVAKVEKDVREKNGMAVVARVLDAEGNPVKRIDYHTASECGQAVGKEGFARFTSFPCSTTDGWMHTFNILPASIIQMIKTRGVPDTHKTARFFIYTATAKSAVAEVPVALGKVYYVTFILEPTPKEELISLTGTAVDEDGKPVEGASAFLCVLGGVGATSGLKQTRTDEEGRFEFDGITPQPYQIALSKEGYPFEAYFPPIPVEKLADKHEFTMHKNRAVEIEYVYQPNGSRDFTVGDLKPKTVTLESDFSRGFRFASGEMSNQTRDFDFRYTNGKPRFHLVSSNGIYDAGKIPFETMNEADANPEKYIFTDKAGNLLPVPAELDHVYVVKTTDSKYAKIVVRKVIVK